MIHWYEIPFIFIVAIILTRFFIWLRCRPGVKEWADDLRDSGRFPPFP